jgi:hypothetical protein
LRLRLSASQQECEKRNWGYTVAGEAEEVRTNGVVFTHIA